MSESRRYAVDFLGLAVLGAAILVSLCLLSYAPTDVVPEPIYPLNQLYQPDVLQYPASSTTNNWCGAFGALIADALLRCFGTVAYVVAATLYLLAFLMMKPTPVTAPCIRLGGWMVTIISLATLTSIWHPSSWAGPMIGPGGYLGALGHLILVSQMGAVAASLVTVLTAAIGMVLCSDWLTQHLQQFVSRTLRRNRPVRASVNPSVDETGSTAPDEPDTDDEEASDQYEDEYVVDDELETDEEDGADQDWDDWDDEDEEQPEQIEPASPEPQPVAATTAAATGLRRLIQRAASSRQANHAPNRPNTEPARTRTTSDPPAPHFRTPRDRKRVTATQPGQKSANVDERTEVMEQLDEASRSDNPIDYDLPSINLLQEAEDFSYEAQENEVRRKARILENTFKNFGFNVKVVEIETGPVIAQYEIELEPGLRLSKITGLADDIAIALRVPSVRIVAPIPGKNTVGIEVPNEERQVVRLREVMEEVNGRIRKMRIPLFLGKDVSGNPLTADLSTLPHLLIAGRTGTGKSVCLNAIISSILMTRRPDEVRMLMIDPKMVELSGYKTLPHLMHPVVTDMRKAEAILAWAVDKMEERYALLAQAGVRHISAYNQLGEEELLERFDADGDNSEQVPTHLPYIVIVADEMADLMMTAGKEVEQHIIRLAQKSRAVGIHLILATQKPTVDVITGLIKSNLPARVAFQVASRTDSRVVLDEMGAEKLLGNGDMLFLWPGTSMLLRGQGTYLADDEINGIVEAVSTGEQDFVRELVQLKVEEPSDSAPGAPLKNRDDLYESAVDIVVREGRGSCSLLQRCLGIGYGRAARLIDFMAEDGIVGPYNGSQAREVLISLADWEAMQEGSGAEEAETPQPEPAEANKRRTNKIVPAPQPQALAETKRDRGTDGENADADADDDDGYEYEYEGENEGDEDEEDGSEAIDEQEADEDQGDQYDDEEYDDEEYDDEEYDGEEYDGEEYADEEYAEAEAGVGADAEDEAYEDGEEYEDVEEDFDSEGYEESDFDDEQYQAERA